MAVALLVLTGLSTACSAEVSFGRQGVSTDELERSATEALTEMAGRSPDSVDCPEELDAEVGKSTRCTLTVGPDTLGFTMTVKAIEGDNVKFDIQVDEAPQ